VEEAFANKIPPPGRLRTGRRTRCGRGLPVGDLRAYERLYSLHGARMKNLARNILGSATDAKTPCKKLS